MVQALMRGGNMQGRQRPSASVAGGQWAGQRLGQWAGQWQRAWQWQSSRQWQWQRRWPWLQAMLLAGGIMLPLGQLGQASPLKADERVMALPGMLQVDGRPAMQADMGIWVYEDERRRGARALFARYLGVDPDRLPPGQRARYEARTGLFLKDSERGKRLSVRVGAHGPVWLPPTDPAGRSVMRAGLPPGLWDGGNEPLRYRVATEDGRDLAEGLLWPVTAQGLSVVSDIDDTIKVSEVGDSRQLLRNTFLKPFEAVPGMAAWYRHIEASAQAVLLAGADAHAAPAAPAAADVAADADAAADVAADAADAPADAATASAAAVTAAAGQPVSRNIRFHYLSSSPIQLLPLLEGFLQQQGFPAGPLLLRESTAWHSLLPGEGESQAHKQQKLVQLLSGLGQRRFILIGDSGEADPEIYGEIARRFPAQVVAVLIRDVSGEPADAPRYRQAFRGLPRERWQLIADGHEGQARLDLARVLGQ